MISSMIRGPFIEGGDTFVLGKDILVGFSSFPRLQPGRADWLQRVIWGRKATGSTSCR